MKEHKQSSELRRIRARIMRRRGHRRSVRLVGSHEPDDFGNTRCSPRAPDGIALASLDRAVRAQPSTVKDVAVPERSCAVVSQSGRGGPVVSPGQSDPARLSAADVVGIYRPHANSAQPVTRKGITAVATWRRSPRCAERNRRRESKNNSSAANPPKAAHPGATIPLRRRDSLRPSGPPRNYRSPRPCRPSDPPRHYSAAPPRPLQVRNPLRKIMGRARKNSGIRIHRALTTATTR